MAVLSVGSLSPPPATAAVFWIVGETGLWTTAVTRIGGYAEPAASGSLRVQVRFVVPGAIVQAQPVAEATAIESKPAAPFGTLSVTVTGVPSVAIVPTFETVSVNVVVPPATNCGECDLVSVRSGASTVVTTCGVVAVSAVARVCERNWAVAWLVIWVPTGSPPLIVTSKLNEVLFPGRPDAASNPPRVALASWPRRKTTLFSAALNAAISSPEASVGLAGAPGPDTSRSEFGT